MARERRRRGGWSFKVVVEGHGSLRVGGSFDFYLNVFRLVGKGAQSSGKRGRDKDFGLDKVRQSFKITSSNMRITTFDVLFDDLRIKVGNQLGRKTEGELSGQLIFVEGNIGNLKLRGRVIENKTARKILTDQLGEQLLKVVLGIG